MWWCRDGTFALGVADGVYMWKQQGIDSGLFSRSLMTYARQAVLEGERDPVKGKDFCPCEAPVLSGEMHQQEINDKPA